MDYSWIMSSCNRDNTAYTFCNQFCKKKKKQRFLHAGFTEIIFRGSGWDVRNQLFITISAYFSDLTCKVETESFLSRQLKVLTILSNWSNLIQSLIVITRRADRHSTSLLNCHDNNNHRRILVQVMICALNAFHASGVIMLCDPFYVVPAMFFRY